MDIRFCDLCNESVPVSDFATGTAYTLKGKVICATCERAMGGGHGSSAASSPGAGSSATGTLAPKQKAASAKRAKAPSVAQPAPAASTAPPMGRPASYAPGSVPYPDPSPSAGGGQRSRAGAAALFVAVGGLAALGTGGLMLAERIDSVESSAQASGYASISAIDQLRSERAGLLAPLEGRIEEAAKSAGAAASSVRTETTTEVAALHARLETAEARSAELRGALDGVRKELQVARAEARSAMEGRDAEVASLQKVVQFHGDALVEMRERIREAGALVASGQVVAGQQGAGAEVGGAGAGNAPGGATVSAPWAALIPDLTNPDEALRLTAVLELGETGDPAVCDFIMPLLTDTDSFVRMVSVQALGDLGYKPAVPKLIDSLSDDRWTVREAARDALRTITGKNFGFDPTVREAEMKKKIDQWRSWWRREGDNFLTKG